MCANAEAGLRLCCSQTLNTGFLASRPNIVLFVFTYSGPLELLGTGSLMQNIAYLYFECCVIFSMFCYDIFQNKHLSIKPSECQRSGLRFRPKIYRR